MYRSQVPRPARLQAVPEALSEAGDAADEELSP